MRRLELVTLIGVYGGLLLPLVYARIVIYPFVYLKLLYFQILVGLSFPAWVALALRDARYRPKRSWLLWSILAWFAAMGLSTVFAANPWHSFFGTQERGIRVGDFVAKCASGLPNHVMRFSIEV